MAQQVTATDTGTGQRRQVELSTGNNELALSSTPPPEPSISALDVALGPTQQALKPLPSHPPTDPVWAANVRDQRQELRARTPTELADDAKRERTTLPWHDVDYTEPMTTVPQLGGLRVPQSAVNWFDPVALMAGQEDVPFAPLKGFFSRFETEVIPRLPKIAQHPKTVQNLVDKFVGKDEWEWMGGKEWLASRGNAPVTKAEVEEWFKANQIAVKEHRLGYVPPTPEAEAAAGARVTQRMVADAVEAVQAEHPELRAEMSRLASQHQDRPINLEAITPQLHGWADLWNRYMGQGGQSDEFARGGGGGARPPSYQNYQLQPAGQQYQEHLVEATPVRVPPLPHAPVNWNDQYGNSRFIGGMHGGITVHNGGVEGYRPGATVRDFTNHPAAETAFPQGRWEVEDPNGENLWFRDEASAKAAAEEGVQRRLREVAAQAEQYHPPHWPGQIKNYFVHLRTTLREVSGIGKILFGEEFQSDAHQAARVGGYRRPGDRERTEAAVEAANAALNQAQDSWVLPQQTEQRANALLRGTTLSDAEIVKGLSGSENFARWLALKRTQIAAEIANRNLESAPPRLPFSKSWQELSLRMLLRDAVERGAAGIGWTTGAQQIKRYNKAVETVGEVILKTSRWSDSGLQMVIKNREGREIVDHNIANIDELGDYVGKVNAKRLLALPGETFTGDWSKVLKFGPNDTLQIGGKGMIKEYDEQMVALGNKLGKPYGVQVEQAPIAHETVTKGQSFRRTPFRPQTWERKPFPGDFEREPFVREEYEREPFDREEPDTDLDNFEADYDNYVHYVHVDPNDFENNASEINDAIEAFRREHRAFFGYDANQGLLFEDAGRLNREAPRNGLTFEARAVGGRRDEEDWRVFARHADGTETEVPFGDALHDETLAESAAAALQHGTEAEPTQWRYTYSENGHHEEVSDWYDSIRETEREAESKREELDTAAHDEQAEEWRRHQRDAHREWERAEEAHDEAESEHEDRHNRAQDRLEAEHEEEQDALEAEARAAKEKAHPGAAEAWYQEQTRLGDAHAASEMARQTAHEVAQDRLAQEWLTAGKHLDRTVSTPGEKVWTLKIPPAWAAAIKKGQPLPQVLLPLTGAGMALMASHKRAAAQQK